VSAANAEPGPIITAFVVAGGVNSERRKSKGLRDYSRFPAYLIAQDTFTVT
jgi:hypothetical protein